MMQNNALHTRKFHVYMPEYYVPRIPKYFTEKRTGRPPMVNGMPVSIEEYMEKDPEFIPDEQFIPEPIYDPFENNMVFSTKSVVEIYTAYVNDVNVQFAHPEDMLMMINIIKEYLLVAAPYASHDPSVADWNNKLVDFSNVLKSTYDEYARKLSQLKPWSRARKRELDVREFLSLFKKG